MKERKGESSPGLTTISRSFACIHTLCRLSICRFYPRCVICSTTALMKLIFFFTSCRSTFFLFIFSRLLMRF